MWVLLPRWHFLNVKERLFRQNVYNIDAMSFEISVHFRTKRFMFYIGDRSHKILL